VGNQTIQEKRDFLKIIRTKYMIFMFINVLVELTLVLLLSLNMNAIRFLKFLYNLIPLSNTEGRQRFVLIAVRLLRALSRIAHHLQSTLVPILNLLLSILKLSFQEQLRKLQPSSRIFIRFLSVPQRLRK